MSLIDTITGLVAPHICVGCGFAGPVLCDDCTVLYMEPVQPRCAGCKKLSDDFKVCSSCKSWLPLRSIFVASNYEGVSELLVRSLKFDCQRAAAKSMSRLMAETLSESSDKRLLCPIPTASSRIRERGFDHALLIAKELACNTGLTMEQLLQRHTNVRQLGSTRANRIKQMESEFSVSKKSMVEGENVLLVDDVMTSGATLAGAARTLRNAGAKSVSAIIFAQKM